MSERLHFLGMCGSLRKGSYNRKLLVAAQELAPPVAEIEIVGLEGVPVYNQDLDVRPDPIVESLKAKVRAADGILFATPEYNYGVPGPLKNAIDAISRPHAGQPFQGKPVGVMSASISSLGGARAVYHLRQSFIYLEMHPLMMPEVFVTFAETKFDPAGRLTDPEARASVERFLAAFVAWTRRLRAGT